MFVACVGVDLYNLVIITLCQHWFIQIVCVCECVTERERESRRGIRHDPSSSFFLKLILISDPGTAHLPPAESASHPSC